MSKEHAIAEKKSNGISKIVVLGLFIIPIVIGIAYVLAFGVNVPMLDDFGFVSILKQYHAGMLSFADMFAQQNEHRLLLPRLIMLPLALATNYDLLSFMLVIQFLVAVCLVVLILKWRKSDTGSLHRYVVLGFLLFSLRQFENWLFGIQVHYATQTMFLFLTLFFLDAGLANQRRRAVFLMIAFLCAVCSSFSNLNGLFVWVAGAAVILIADKRNTLMQRIFSPIFIPWVMTAGIVWALYLSGLSFPSNHTSYRASLHDPVRAVIVFFSTCGTAVIPDLIGSILVGAASIFLVVYIAVKAIRDGSIADHALWIGFAVYTMCAASAITMGRAGFSERIGLAPRYGMFTMPLIIAAYSMVCRYRHERPARIMLMVFQVFIVGGLLYSTIIGVRAGQRWHAHWSENASQLRSYHALSDAQLRGLMQYSVTPRSDLVFLEKHRYSPFNTRPDERAVR